ncbi:unnamed protein product [Sphagnum balticum]
MSIRFTDIDKSFNPVIGETFQGRLGGFSFLAEQISHHPPVSAFLIDCGEVVVSGALEVRASMGINSAKGLFRGDVTARWRDGGRVIGRMPCGVLSGYLFGRYAFVPDGASYCFDPDNALLCSYEVTEGDNMRGCIGKLTPTRWSAFRQMVESSDEAVRNRRYEDYEHYKESAF